LAVIDFTRAANLGDPYAIDMLGKMYLLGTSISPNHDKAIEWLERAAALGYQPSKDILPMALNPAMKPIPELGSPRL
jgi:TPR repeat protein